MDFGMIRSLAQAAPSKDAWEALCGKLDGLSQPHEIEQVLGYLDGALRRWPRELRVVPKVWRKALFLDGKEVMRVAEVGEVRQPPGWHLERLAKTGAPGFRNLRRLSLVSYSGDMKWLSGLIACEGVAGLEAFELMGLRSQAQRGRPYADVTKSWGALCRAVRSHDNLESFEIRNAKSILRKHYEAFLEEPLGVKSLTIERSRLEPLHMGAIARQLASGLEELDLGGNELYDEGWVELAAHDLSGLRSLRLDRTRGGDEGAQALAGRSMPDLEELSCLRVDMTEVGVAAWMSASFGRLRVLELDLRGSSEGLAGALRESTGLTNLERVKLRFSSLDEEGLCRAMAKLETLQGLSEVHLLELSVSGLEVLLRSEALSGVRHLKLELVRMADGIWDALTTNPHLAELEHLTIARSANADLATPKHLAFCKGKGLGKLRRLTFEECSWDPLRYLATNARLGTLDELNLRHCKLQYDWLRKLFGNPDLERVGKFTLEVNRALTLPEARVCVHPDHEPREWSPPYAAYKALSKR